MTRMRNGSRTMMSEKQLWQESELTMQRQRLGRSRMTWVKLKMRNWPPASPEGCVRRWWWPLESVWAILQVQTMGRMGKMRMMKRQSRARWVKMTNPAGWWAQSPTRFNSTWRGFSRRRWSFSHWHNRDGVTQPGTLVKDVTITARAN